MSHYLTNIDKAEAPWVEKAAKASGQDVRYQDSPMPVNSIDSSDYYAKALASGQLNYLGCIVGYEDKRDYSAFWAAWRKLRGE